MNDDNQIGGVTIGPRPEPAKPAATAPTQPQPAPKVLTAEELKKKRADLSRSMGWGEPPAEEVVVTEGTKATEGTEAPPVVEPQPKPSRTEPEPEAMDAQRLIRETAREVGREVARVVRPPEAERPTAAAVAEPVLELSAEDQADYELVLFMAEQSPDKWGDLPAKVMAYYRALYEYQNKWFKENPNAEFDPNADEHEGWFTEHPSPVDGRLLERAKIDREVDRRVNERLAPLEERVTMVDAEKVLSAAEPAIRQAINVWQYNLCRSVDEDLAKLLVDGQQRLTMTPETIAALDRKDPISKAVLDKMCMTLNPVIGELEKSAVPGARYKFNPAGNEVHRFIDGHRQAIERDLKAASAADRLRDGKEWLSLSEMSSRETAIRQGRGTAAAKEAMLEDLYASYWTVTVDDLQDVITDELARQAREQIKEIKTLGERAYGTPREEIRPAEPQPPTAPTVEPVPGNRDRFRPPSLSSSSDVVTAPQNVRGGAKTRGEQAADVHFK